MLKETSNLLLQTVKSHFAKYSDISDDIASVILSEDKWSLKEIIGHLIDSASNNHQRIMRLQTEQILKFPGYHYSWTKTGKINSMKYSDLMDLWKNYNTLLAHLIYVTDESCLNNIWDNGEEQYTLIKLITWYVSHMQDHLKQFEERLSEIKNLK